MGMSGEMMRNEYKILIGKPEGNRQLGRYGCRWKSNIKMNLTDIRWEVWTGFISIRMRTSENSCEHRNGTSGP